MKQQIQHRLGIAHVRDAMARFVGGELSRDQVLEELRIGKTRLYELRGSFLAARAAGKACDWTPGVSGGDHAAPWPDEVHRFLRRVLSPDGEARRYSYAFAASEAGRLFGQTLDRAQVRRWAIDQGIKIAVPKPRPPAHARRWQRTNVVLSVDLEFIADSWVSNVASTGEAHIWFRNLPTNLSANLWANTTKQHITIHLPWSQRDVWREWVASGPSGHTFTFNKATKTLPDTIDGVGTWQSSVTQNVTWWKDLDAPTVLVVK